MSLSRAGTEVGFDQGSRATQFPPSINTLGNAIKAQICFIFTLFAQQTNNSNKLTNKQTNKHFNLKLFVFSFPKVLYSIWITISRIFQMYFVNCNLFSLLG